MGSWKMDWWLCYFSNDYCSCAFRVWKSCTHLYHFQQNTGNYSLLLLLFIWQIYRMLQWKKLWMPWRAWVDCNRLCFGCKSGTSSKQTTLLYRFQVQAVSLKMWRRPSCPFLVFGMEYPESLNLFYKFIEIIVGIETRVGFPLIISGVGDDNSPRIIILNTQHLLSTDYKIYIS